MIDRIRQLMEYKGLSSSQFADSIEIPRAVLSHILSERNKPSLDVMVKIAAAFRDIRMAWLFMGEGSMVEAAKESTAQAATAAEEVTKPETPSEPWQEGATGPAPERTQPSPENAQAKAAADTGNVINKETNASFLQAILANPKSIEQVMIFYTDRTFAVYKPG
ncbi:helix-turn-helix domain-containing protein [Pontibacter sp. SGAir0037]|uniref:helix-turn-helix domain-containing protein n=1 Tax=Pontibacter sp. SGAir0037 TaxID=2571030 RepID=UPI0010CCEBC4|nr:helix-turn-helix transcriptional regulator [Pontibacter sp. SGAir0037]QCR22211.1 hypothetical protein C1N53_07540 [Pontibacter sp. SGAir0037]